MILYVGGRKGDDNDSGNGIVGRLRMAGVEVKYVDGENALDIAGEYVATLTTFANNTAANKEEIKKPEAPQKSVSVIKPKSDKVTDVLTDHGILSMKTFLISRNQKQLGSP